ncbi:F0F1 ATP synthase subunit delta [Acetobacterium carbinolicum]|jgi:F-type H+-transporting ATPase subunit delta|uniref:F0F1 ATP synthase subunit delta n=1 Tax=Acetobacterium TaxID=33951 RepID=UPI000DBEBFE4|nr:MULTISPECIES: F0F1 ATP synthase subunit delta [unclassified Acetobacterium]AWW27134.1 hypothetical protein DOZ58_11135 [Acetobacterium sp. KB-1]MDZ5724335.1 F0F1 ATP synthase subunit delta [Acetobacterium sp. K1/6]
MSLVARKYAHALFLVADEHNQIEEILADFTGVVDLVRSEKNLLNLILTPSLNSDEKKGILLRVFETVSSQYVKNYLKILVDKGRFENIFEIYDDFKAQCNEHRGLVEARVLTVVPLDEALRIALEENLAKRFSKKVILENVIDASILGGAVVYVGGQVIDGSIRNQLDQMKTQMNSLRLQ